ncbi:hypothetical protein Zmor_022725 [Zophobas morio]|uniref:Uncharacterized protein n=1 Tax=Zophobas morio TaxID=2755281 RepID=A0AA38M5M3_9CUCU|nr:hypothetical protein Zmor_022725 [Zophobas morio]
MWPKLFVWLLATLWKLTWACENFAAFNYTLDDHDQWKLSVEEAEIISVSDPYDEVSVQDQFIPRLCCKILNFTHPIEQIIFDNCAIEELEEVCFSEAIQQITESLTITNNKLTSVKKGTFRNIQLKKIHLHNNRIKILEDVSFSNLSNLEILNLDQNNLQALNPNAFVVLPKLSTLNLMFNQIKILQEGAFRFLSTNPVVKLKCNQISRVEDAFKGSSARDIVLDLSGNRMENLAEGVFSNHEFEDVNLNQNPMKNIAKKFCGENCSIKGFQCACCYLNDDATQTIKDLQLVQNTVSFGGACRDSNGNYILNVASVCGGSKNNRVEIYLYIWKSSLVLVMLRCLI